MHSSPSDELPLADLPVPHSQIEFLSAIGHIRGLRPTDVEHSRVLEIGCGGGGNLLPMAERRPNSVFLGIDSSASEIARAQAASDRIGTHNVQFHCQDIRDLPDDLGKFEYVIINDVYSAGDQASRDSLMAICQRHLAPDGIAFVSYNTYPGWQAAAMLSHTAKYAARNATTDTAKVAAALRLFEFLKGVMVPSRSAYAAMVQVELERQLRKDDGFLRHDLMSGHASAIYFRDFMAHAQRSGLQLLGDGALGIRWVDELDVQTELRLRDVTTDIVEQEQFRDTLRNRPFRQTLLCRAGLELRRTTSVPQLEGLYLESELRPQNANVSLQSQELERFVAANGLQISTAAPMMKAALMQLSEIWPKSASLAALVAGARARTAAAGSDTETPELDVDRLKENLLQSCMGQVVEVSSVPYPFMTAVSPRPVASPLARWQAENGSLATNRKHQSLRLDRLDQHMLRRLDGTRDISTLTADLVRSALDGELIVIEQGQPVNERERLELLLTSVVPPRIERMAQTALLVR